LEKALIVEKRTAINERTRAIEVIKTFLEEKKILKISDKRKKERVIETVPSQKSPRNKRMFDLIENSLARISPTINDNPPNKKMTIISLLHREGIEKSFTSLMYMYKCIKK